MNIGIFAKTFVHSSLEAILDAVHENHISTVQFNMSCAGLSSMPDFIDPVITKKIYYETKIRSIEIAAVSGTFNMIHPDKKERQSGIQKLEVLAAACKPMETSVITLCTGTRDRDNMWKKHPDNDDDSAWKDLLETMEQAIKIAEKHNVILAFEPEPANVVENAEKGRKLLDEIKSANLKVVMDAANLFQMENINQIRETLDKSFNLLGNDIVIAHAKDIKIAGKELEVVAAGEGILDYDFYLYLLHKYAFNGALILHGLEEQQVGKSIQFLNEKLQHSEQEK